VSLLPPAREVAVTRPRTQDHILLVTSSVSHALLGNCRARIEQLAPDRHGWFPYLLGFRHLLFLAAFGKFSFNRDALQRSPL
jgi:hypothetical protein